jgi:hypothetical protein
MKPGRLRPAGAVAAFLDVRVGGCLLGGCRRRALALPHRNVVRDRGAPRVDHGERSRTESGQLRRTARRPRRRGRGPGGSRVDVIFKGTVEQRRRISGFGELGDAAVESGQCPRQPRRWQKGHLPHRRRGVFGSPVRTPASMRWRVASGLKVLGRKLPRCCSSSWLVALVSCADRSRSCTGSARTPGGWEATASSWHPLVVLGGWPGLGFVEQTESAERGHPFLWIPRRAAGDANDHGCL